MPGSSSDYLSPRERDIVRRAIEAIEGIQGYAQIEANVGRLGWLARLAQTYPSFRYAVLGGNVRTEETLIAELVEQDRIGSELDLPTKAHVGRAFLVAKVHLFRAFLRAFREVRDTVPVGLVSDVRHEHDQTVYTILGEEVLLGLIRCANVQRPIKEAAARSLIRIWDEPAHEITDFSPVLEAVWFARNRVEVELGTMMGVTEFFRFVQQDVPAEFVAYFSRDDISDEEEQAFEEFLFGLVHEEIVRLRNEMHRQGVASIDNQFARQVLGYGTTRVLRRGDALAMYRSYRRRALACDFRRLSGLDGPRRTAEEFLMQAILQRKLRVETPGAPPTHDD